MNPHHLCLSNLMCCSHGVLQPTSLLAAFFLSCEHNSNYFQWLAFSHLPFTFFWTCLFSCLEDGGAVYCLTTAISHWGCSSHSSCRVQVNSPHKDEIYEHWPRQTDIFLPSNGFAWKQGSKLRIRVRGKQKKSARLALYKMDWGHRALGGKWKTLAYEGVRLSWHDIFEDSVKSNQGGDTAKYCSIPNQEKI